MARQMLIYEGAVPVNKDRHTNLYVKTGADYSFARSVNSVPLMAVEFPSAEADYAIVFAGRDDDIMPAVILGVQDGQNLFLKEDGQWDARYVPAFIRRYPFVFSSNDDGQTFTLCIDEAFSGCNTDGVGERLFDANGERTQYLAGVLKFLQEYQAHFQRTRVFCNKLRELELLEPVTAQFRTAGDQRASLSGFMAVNREKLKALSGETLETLIRTDELELVYLHLQSLRNFAVTVERAASGAVVEESNVAEAQDEEMRAGR